MPARYLGSMPLDDLLHTWITRDGIDIPFSRLLTADQMVNRYGRMSFVKEDAKELQIQIKGWWADGAGSYWRDFKAACLTQKRVNLVLGDGTRFEWVDCIALPGVLLASDLSDMAHPNQRWAWVMQLLTYEPVAREIAPTLQSLGNLATGAGTNTTNLTIPYAGTFFTEPAWQWTLVIPAGQSVTALNLQNTTTGESCTYAPSGGIAAGTWTVLMDASGGVVSQTPNNNQYGVLTFNSPERGVSIQQSGGAVLDQDFTGQVPTLIPSPAPAVPPVAYNNTLVATVTATAALTTATLSVLAPKRYIR